MADLTFLYLNEIAAGLKIKAQHIIANVQQLIARSNLHDASLATLVSADSALDFRLDTAEATLAGLVTDVATLEGFNASGWVVPTIWPHVVDLAVANHIYVPQNTSSPIVTLPVPTTLPTGTTVTILPAANQTAFITVRKLVSAETYNEDTHIQTGPIVYTVFRTSGSGSWISMNRAEGTLRESMLLPASSSRTLDVSSLWSRHHVMHHEANDNTDPIIYLPPLSLMDCAPLTFSLRVEGNTCTIVVMESVADGGSVLQTINSSYGWQLVTCWPNPEAGSWYSSRTPV